MQNDRRWFWPLVLVALVFSSAATALLALAIEDPVEPWLPQAVASEDPAIGRCLAILNLFAPMGDPLDSSDVPIIVAAAVLAAGGMSALWLAARRR